MMDEKGQSFIEDILAVIIVLAISFGGSWLLTGFTALIIYDLSIFFLFLGYFVLLITIFFGIFLNLSITWETLKFSGSASAVFFVLAYVIPKVEPFPQYFRNLFP